MRPWIGPETTIVQPKLNNKHANESATSHDGSWGRQTGRTHASVSWASIGPTTKIPVLAECIAWNALQCSGATRRNAG